MIKNFPNYAYEYPFIVYCVENGEKWFYGAYRNVEKAREVAVMIGGYVA